MNAERNAIPAASAPPDAAAIAVALSGARHIGRVVWLDECESTNDEIWKLAADGESPSPVIFAGTQTRGRGRQGRSWTSPPGSGLTFSLLAPSGLQSDCAGALALAVAVAIAETAGEDFGVNATIKWPNDVLVGASKLAGVLVESRSIRGATAYAVGVGINVNLDAAQAPEALRGLFTSLRMETGAPCRLEDVAAALLSRVDRWLDAVRAQRWADIEARWQRYSCLLGRTVTVECAGEVHTGTVVDLQPLEGIALQLDTGYVRIFRAEHTHVLKSDF